MTDQPIKLYRPSNGTEGECFQSQWCSNCQRDKVMNGEIADYDLADDTDLCQIIASTYLYDIDDPQYPREWRYNAEGCPVCTAFVSVDVQGFRDIRDPLTIDMFAQPSESEVQHVS